MPQTHVDVMNFHHKAAADIAAAMAISAAAGPCQDDRERRPDGRQIEQTVVLLTEALKPIPKKVKPMLISPGRNIDMPVTP